MWAVCENPDCGNYRWPINIGDTSFPVVDEETGETTWITTDVYCGVCGQPITQIVDVKPDDPVEPDVEAPV